VTLRASPIVVLSLVVALACAIVGGVLALHYPIAPMVAFAAFSLWIAVNLRWPRTWLVAIPTLLPICGFATWTGWFTFEELDLLVLGTAAGGYARLAWAQKADVARSGAPPGRTPLIAIILALLFALSYGLSLQRGIADAGGFRFDWIGNYESAMNSVRLVKSFAGAILLWPLLHAALRVDGDRAVELLAAGMSLGLGGASLAALWERAAFTDVLNFSTDYRTTALFWEMHVGGAAFDGFLALTVPFAVWELTRKSNPWRIGVALAIGALAAYACLTTFSRGVYLAIPIGLAVFGALVVAQRGIHVGTLALAHGWKVALLALLTAVAVYFVFRAGGYRSLLAFCVTVAVALEVTHAARRIGFWSMVTAWSIGLTLGILDGLFAPGIAKGPYVVFAIAFFANAGFMLWRSNAKHPLFDTARWALLVWLGAAAAVVALHWGGVGAFWDSVVVLIGVLALAMHNSAAAKTWIPAAPRMRIVWLGTLALIAGSVAVFSGGAYMGDRFATTSSDLELRTRHWSEGIGMLHGNADWMFGKGLGRFPSNYFFNIPEGAFPGSFSLQNDAQRRYLSLAGPSYSASWGDLFRVAQRVPAEPGIYTALLDVRTSRKIELHLEVCEQHLLYNAACAAESMVIPDAQGWQRVSVLLDGRSMYRGAWYAPHLAFFSMSVESSKQSLDIDDVALIGPDGSNILRNGTFADGMARWIPVSEKFHLPWHIKNLALNLLFDQGIFGLALFACLLAAALWRLAFGTARDHPLAPPLAAALVGFVVVGAFDSLLDVPRVAFLFYILLLAGFSVPRAIRSASRQS
jgi:hypothetical protein